MGENKGVLRLFWLRTRVWLGCFWRDQGCVQAASGENKGVFRLLQVRKRVCSGYVWREQGCV